MLFNTSNTIQHYLFTCTQLNGSKNCNVILIIQIKSFVCTQLNSFKYRKWLNISSWLIDGTLTSTITPSQSGPGSNGIEEILHILQKSITEASPSDAV